MDAMMSQAMGQGPCYFYNHEIKMNAPQAQPAHQMAAYQIVPTLPTTPMYSRPNLSCSQLPTLYINAPSVITPTSVSPPTFCKLADMLETESADGYFPATPPLLTLGSAMGSPKTCDVLQTPMNPMVSGLDGMGIKDGAGALVLDWTSCGSPPLSPVYLQLQPAKVPSLTTNTSDILSPVTCPSLSPSPTLYARSVISDQDIDFRGPRDLTVSGSPGTALAPEFAPAFNLVSNNERFQFSSLPGPSSSINTTDCRRKKRQKKGSRVAKPASNTANNNVKFVCDVCNKQFHHQHHFNRHYRSLHTTERPFKCNTCGKEFATTDNRNRHAWTQHPDNKKV